MQEKWPHSSYADLFSSETSAIFFIFFAQERCRMSPCLSDEKYSRG